MSSDTSTLGSFAITILRAYWAYDSACTQLGVAIHAVAEQPATREQIATIRAAARNVLATGDDYRAYLVVATNDAFGEQDICSERQILQELDQLRSELAKAAVYDTDEFERLNAASTPARASSS